MDTATLPPPPHLPSDLVAVKARDIHHMPPLINAAMKGHSITVLMFLEFGEEIDQKDSKMERTALLWAAYYGQLECVQLLLKKGANIKAKDKNKFTALMLAAQRGNKQCVQHLLKSEAKTEAKDKLVRTVSQCNDDSYFPEQARATIQKGNGKLTLTSSTKCSRCTLL